MKNKNAKDQNKKKLGWNKKDKISRKKNYKDKFCKNRLKRNS